MDYGKLLTRSWDIIWEHKFLILLGLMVALGSGGRGTSLNLSLPGEDLSELQFDLQPPRLAEDLGVPLEAFIAMAVVIALLVLFLGLIVWVVSTIARGGLIAAVDAIERGAPYDFGQAFMAGWGRVWRLLGISLLAAAPALVMIVPMVVLVVAVVMGDEGGAPMEEAILGMIAVLVPWLCLFVLVMIVVSVLQKLAMRACMLEAQGVLAAYRRAVQVAGANLGSVFLVWLLQVALGIAIGMGLLVPGLIMAFCCLLWPVWLLIRGAIAAYFSTFWTLAWREWT
jgi:hypothetical protein